LAKISNASAGRKFSEEHRAKLSAANLGKHPNCIKIEVLYLKTEIKTEYNSIREAARALKISLQTISNYFIRGAKLLRPQKKPYKGRYIFVYKKID
jgi:hypothetical protein